MAKCVRNEMLADLIRGSAKDLIDMADQIAAVTNDGLTDFDIWLRFPNDGLPTIETSSSMISKNCYEQIKRYYDKQGDRNV